LCHVRGTAGFHATMAYSCAVDVVDCNCGLTSA
jgi:hypothetical protein